MKMYDIQVDNATKANDPRLPEYKANRLKFTIQSFERRVQDRPTDMTLRFELGKAYFQAGPSFLDKATSEFQQSVKDPKKKTDSHNYLGAAFQRKKLYDMADKQYEHAEQGVFSQDRLNTIWYNRAVCNAEAGNLAKAVELGKRIMEADINYKDIGQLVDRWQKGQK
jgi:tetratricopeptide (TPR) repeat protein